MKHSILFALAVLLASCGGDGNQTDTASEKAVATEALTDEPAVSDGSTTKLFSREQQLIKDAESIQGLLDKNAQDKKKAIDLAR